MSRFGVAALFVLAFTSTAGAASICDPDALQSSGSVYRICMPAAADYNGSLVIYAHGFQDAGTPVGIPEDQQCVGTTCVPELVNSLGFAFATNSYSKTGLAVVQGKDDVLDLVQLFTLAKGKPLKVFLVGASEGGIITALAVEQHPEVFSAGIAACGPVGDFRLQINYFGDARATFETFFPGIIPGGAFDPPQQLIDIWPQYYDLIVKPIVMNPVNRSQLDQWVKVAKLPFDAGNYLATVEQSVRDVLRYSVVNQKDAATTLGGHPFDNASRWYTGSNNDIVLNLLVPRMTADVTAIQEMATRYATTGVLERPLITIHTRRDQQVPYWHEQIYQLKTLASGALFRRHVNLPIDRYEHCNFNSSELLFSFGLMLFYDNNVQQLSGVGSALKGEELARFERLARDSGLPAERSGAKLSIQIKK